MSLRRDEVNLVVTINGTNAGKSINDLKNKTRDLQRQLSKMEIGSDDFKRVKAELDGINKELAEATGRVKQVDRAMDGVGKTSGAIPGIFGRINSALNAAGIIGLINLLVTAGQKLFAIGGQAIKLYNEGAKADAQIKAALTSTNQAAGRSFEQLAEQAAQLQKTTLFDDEATKGAQGLLLTFTNIRGEIFDDTIPAIQDLATAMATATGESVDLKGASIQVGKALNDPIKGITALTRVGVTFSDQQKAQIKQFVATNDLASAQKIILAELGREFGGSAKAAAEAGTGGWTKMRNQLGDLQERMGEFLAQVGDRLAPIFQGAIDIVGQFISAMLDGERATGTASGAINFAVAVIKGYIGAWQALIGAALGFQNVIKSMPEIIRSAFASVTASTEILAKKTQLAFTFDDAAEAKLRADIKRLEASKDQARTTGEVIKGAFMEGYNKKLFGSSAAASPGAAAAPAAGVQDGGPTVDPAAVRAKLAAQVKAAQDAKLAALQSAFDRENLIIEGQLLQQETTEQAAAKRRLDNEAAFFQKKMELLRQFGQAEGNEYLKLQNELTQIKIKQEEAEYLRAEQATVERLGQLTVKALESENKTNAAQLALLESRIATENKLHGEKLAAEQDLLRRSVEVNTMAMEEIGTLTAEFFIGQKKDQKAYLKDLLKLLLSAIQKQVLLGIAGSVATEASSKPFPANLLTTGAKVAAINIAFAAARAAVGSFSGGGYTGPGIAPPDSSGHRPAGIVHDGEYVVPKWMVNSPQHGATVNMLERARRIGYAEGGLVNTTPTAAPIGGAGPDQTALRLAMMQAEELRALRADLNNWRTRLKADVSYFDIEDTGRTLNGLRDEAGL